MSPGPVVRERHEDDPRSMPLAATGLALVGVAAGAVMVMIALLWTGGARESVVSSHGLAAAAGPGRETPHHPRKRQLFAPTSIWNKRLPANTAIDPASPALVADLAAEAAREQQAGIGPWLGTAGTTTLYRVSAAQRRVRVKLEAHPTPAARALQRAFDRVPIPRDARPAAGSDGHMTIWQPATDRLWEFFAARHLADGWHARWGGAIRRVSRSPGYYSRRSWPGARPSWGATASSLPVVAGTIMSSELRAGRIGHALAINLPAPRAGVFAWPAQRTDGTGPVTALPEGARLRLDPTLDLAALHLPRLTRIIAEAAQRYGLVVRDQTHRGILFFAQNPSQLRKNPYRGYFGRTTPAGLLSGFPWNRLQVLEMHLCSTAPCRR